MSPGPLEEKVMEIYNREIEKAELRGIKKAKLKTKEEVDKSVLEVAKTMINKNFSKEDILECTNITEEEYLSLLEA